MPRMPAIFFGHGNPMNALADNAYTQGWAQLGRAVPRPRAVLAISAHWYVPEVAVTAMAQYPAPGSPELARRIQSLLAPAAVRLDESTAAPSPC